jgi:flagellar hook-associated protein 3 FlgL
MRVTSNNYTENLITHFHSIARRQLNLQDQIATGQRIQDASEDPFAAQQVLQLRDHQAANAQYQKNIGVHQEFATVTHGLMRNLQKVLDRAQEIAFTVSDINSPEDLRSYSKEVDQLLEHAVQIANSQHRGEFVLAGTKTDTKPFVTTESASGDVTSVAFTGNTNVAESEIAPGATISSRVPGENRSGVGERGLITDSQAGADIFAHLIALRDQLASGDLESVRTTTRAQLLADEENVLSHMARNGALQSRLEGTLGDSKDQALTIENEISNRADVDLPQAIMRLNQQQTNYQAALQSAASIMNMSLLSFLR